MDSRKNSAEHHNAVRLRAPRAGTNPWLPAIKFPLRRQRPALRGWGCHCHSPCLDSAGRPPRTRFCPRSLAHERPPIVSTPGAMVLLCDPPAGRRATRDMWNGVNSQAVAAASLATCGHVRRKLDQIDAVTRFDDLPMISPAAPPRWWLCRSSSSASSPRRHALPLRRQPQAPPSARAE